MTKEEIIEKLKAIFKMVVKSKVNVDDLNPNADIKLDLGIDSIGVVYIAISIEQEFGVELGDVSANTFKTVNDVVEYIYNKVNK